MNELAEMENYKTVVLFAIRSQFAFGKSRPDENKPKNEKTKPFTP